MKPFYWVLLGLTGILSIILLIAGISMHGQKPTIYTIPNDTYTATIADAVGTHNTHFTKSNITINDVQYIEDSIAVVKTTVESKTSVNFIFEYYNGTLYLTNYSSKEFTESDFNSPGITEYVINAISQH